MVHQSSDNLVSTKICPDTSDVIERRQASERLRSEPTAFKIDPTFETPENLKLLQAAGSPEQFKGGVAGFYAASSERLAQQTERMQAPDCSVEEMQAMQNNNAFMIEASTKRVSVVLSKNNRANFVNEGSLSMSS